jgi:flavin-binding protein dodecin
MVRRGNPWTSWNGCARSGSRNTRDIAGEPTALPSRLVGLHILACWQPIGGQSIREAEMAVASVSKITSASPTSFDAAIQEGLARASKTLRGITGLHVIEQKASVTNGKIAEYRVTMEVTFILEG